MFYTAFTSLLNFSTVTKGHSYYFILTRLNKQQYFSVHRIDVCTSD